MMGALISKGYKYSAIDDTCDGQQSPADLRRSRRLCDLVVLVVLLILSNVITFLGSNGWLYLRRNGDCETCPRAQLAPFMSLDRSFHVEQFNTFDFNVTKYTERAIDAGDEVEKRWADLGIYGAPIIVPSDESQYFDFGPDTLKVEAGQKNAPYAGAPAKIQAQHFLHCVNLLRMGLWYNHDYYRNSKHPSFNDAQDVMYGPYTLGELHTAHCVDQLRQLIMCDVDISVVPFQPDKTDDLKNYLDFAQRRQCHDWQSMMSWHQDLAWKEFALPEEKDIRGHDGNPYFSWSGRD